MKVQEFIKEINNTYPDIDKNKLTSEELIKQKEISLSF